MTLYTCHFERSREIYMSVWQIILLVVIVAMVAAVVAAVRTRRKDIKKVAYMMDALEDGELNFRFQDRNKFNRTLNRIRTIFEKQRQAHEQDSWTKTASGPSSRSSGRPTSRIPGPSSSGCSPMRS